MKDFSDYLKEEGLLQKLFEYYKVDLEEIATKKFLINLIKEIDEKSSSFNVLKMNYEFLGTLYEKFLNPDERKGLGQYYTPKSVVSKILSC